MSLEQAAVHWRTLIQERAAQTASLQTGAGGGFFDQLAQRFARMPRTSSRDRLLSMMLPQASLGASVIDVGAGTGHYAIPLAKAGAHVTAVEPTQGMHSVLAQVAVEEQVADRLTVVPALWEDAAVPPADLVLCSDVVHFVEDAVPFLRKLDNSARQHVYLSIRVTQIGAKVADLWEQVHGVPRCPEPSFIDLYNLLYEMGIVANVETMPWGEGRGGGPGGGATTLEEAVASVRSQLLVGPDPGVDQIVRDYVAERMEEREGRWVWRGPALRAAVLWWARGDRPGAAE